MGKLVKKTASALDVSEFYHQLALLTASKLPLPDILSQMDESFRNREFKHALQALSSDTANGQTLAEAMRRHPQLFSEQQIKLIELGESQGILAATLQDAAMSSMNDCRMVQMLKEIITYPIVVTAIALLLLIGTSLFVIPQFEAVFQALLEGATLPTLTQLVFDVSYLINNFLPVVIVLYGLFIGGSIWLLSSSRKAGNFILLIAQYFPYATVISYNAAMAKTCSLWALFMHRKIPTEEIFPVIAKMIQMPQLQQALCRIAENCRAGYDLKDSIEAESDIAQLLKLIIRTTPEEKLAEELNKLAPIFSDRSIYGSRQLRNSVELLSILSICVSVGLVILLLLTPILRGLL
jgi:type IV pilus assembly protein PilC